MVSLKKLVRDQSDHNLLLLNSKDNVIPEKRREFKFDTSWLKNDLFLPKVAEIWEKPVRSNDPIDIINIKLKRFKSYFKGWGSNIFGHFKKRKKELKLELALLEQLEEDGELSPQDFAKKTGIQVEIYEMDVEEEAYWFQKSQARWLIQGDLNTAYFHRIANGRRRKNLVHSLEDNGVMVEGTDNLLKLATDYYKELFGPAPGNAFVLSPGLWNVNEILSDEDNAELTKPFSEEEVKNALFSMEVN